MFGKLGVLSHFYMELFRGNLILLARIQLILYHKLIFSFNFKKLQHFRFFDIMFGRFLKKFNFFCSHSQNTTKMDFIILNKNALILVGLRSQRFFVILNINHCVSRFDSYKKYLFSSI